MASKPQDTLQFPSTSRLFLKPYLPPPTSISPYPFTTLTFATSLDSQLALSPGHETLLSGPVSKAMTHYLRSKYNAILVGVGTAIADKPALNCRLEGVGLEGQPRPIILDPRARWEFTSESKVLKLAREETGKAPFIITGVEANKEKSSLLTSIGGKFIVIKMRKTESGKERMDWNDVLKALRAEGLMSIMVEGGGKVINGLLVPEDFTLINSVIITIAPTWLGLGGVVVSPERRLDHMAAVRLQEVKWYPFGEDVVMCGKIQN